LARGSGATLRARRSPARPARVPDCVRVPDTAQPGIRSIYPSLRSVK